MTNIIAHLIEKSGVFLRDFVSQSQIDKSESKVHKRQINMRERVVNFVVNNWRVVLFSHARGGGGELIDHQCLLR